MLEVKNLCKQYKTGKDTIVNALDDVSIKFPNKGMVFLLGKSGSGKSTLLNVCGGLDFPDSGEIIVKGKSSKGFSKSDFDSYRNTFIGFIFQEYNILNEFSVENNIALALELQGKSKDNELIRNILKDVDLESFAKRKPTTLSGGQKQRIAIARALIKNPEIIMADEPTGALDSNTGKQVLDTLKELSKEKLVIIVSHDREFASIYGDRIIELMDGKIISDFSKTYSNPEKIGNIIKIEDQTLSIPNGKNLNNDDFVKINEFIKSTDNEIILTKNSQDIKSYKRSSRISDDNSKECFIETNENLIENNELENDAKLIKSRLPIRHAFKIGSSGLKYKPFRLFFTILLSSIALTLLGIVSTVVFFDINKTAEESLLASRDEYISISKQFKAIYNDDEENSSSISTNLSEDEVNNLKSKYNDDLILYYDFSKTTMDNLFQYNSSNISIVNSNINNNEFYSNRINGFTEQYDKFNIVIGEYTKSSNEVMVSKYTFDSILNSTLYDPATGGKLEIDSINDYDKVSIQLFNNYYKISGIYDSDSLIDSKYLSLIEKKNDYELLNKWNNELDNALFTLVVVSSDFKNQKIKANDYFYQVNDFELIYGNVSERIYNAGALYDGILLNGDKYNNSTNTIGLNKYSFRSFFTSTIYNLDDYRLNDYCNQKYNGSLDQIMDSFIENMDSLIDVYKDIYNKAIEYYGNDIFRITLNGNDVNMCIADGDYGCYLSRDLMNEYKIVDEYSSRYKTKFIPGENDFYKGAFIKKDAVKNDLYEMVKNHFNYNDNDTKIVINNSVMSTIDTINYFLKIFTKIITIVGIVLACFAALLLFNFISVSISSKKKEIGILRAVGARGIDVFKIFFSESFIIIFICVILSLIATYICCGIINNEISEGIATIRIFIFGFKTALSIILLSILILLIGTFAPVNRIARKKPVDSIRSI